MADQILDDLTAADPLRATLGCEAVLDDVRVRLRLWMNPRSFRWSIDVMDSAGRPLIEGHALVAQADVLRPYQTLGLTLPPGLLFCAPVALDGSEPSGFTAWRDTHRLMYRPAADLA